MSEKTELIILAIAIPAAIVFLAYCATVIGGCG